jgi:hypothetical protein
MAYKIDLTDERREAIDEFLKGNFEGHETIGELLDSINDAEGFDSGEKVIMAFITGEVITRQQLSNDILKVLMGKTMGVPDETGQS